MASESGKPGRRLIAATLVLAVALAASGCTAYRSFRKAKAAEDRDDWDAAVVSYLDAVAVEPDNIGYKISLHRARVRASQAHFEKGKRFTQAGRQDLAVIEYQQAVQLDTTNQYAAVELAEAFEDLAEVEAGPDRMAQMKEKAKGAKAQPPQLDPRSDEPIRLSFPKPTNVKDIYRALAAAAGINITFDSQLKEEKVTVELTGLPLRAALETIMRTANHFYKVLDPQTIIVAADNAQNRRTYEDLVIRTFFLSNADAKDVLNVIRTLIDARKIAIIPQLNALVLRDTADKVAVAEKIIEANDKALSEVVVDVELLQVDSTKAQELGVQLSNYSVTQSLSLGGSSNSPNPLRVSDLGFINQANWILSVPNILYQFFKTASDAELLARPSLRISEGQKATLHIGDKVPIPTTTFNTTQTIGGNIVPITSFQYQDVGIKIEVEPRVHYNKEITMKITVEVSNLAGSVSGSGGVSQPIIGTRNINSTIRLRDGETNMLAGLYRNDKSAEETGIPWLSDLPVLGRLFSKQRKNSKQTDVILTMTPHIIRVPNVTEEDLMPIWVGTENNITFQGNPRVDSPVEESPLEAPEKQMPEESRRRAVPFPQGVTPQEGQDGEGKPLAPPAGGLPSDPFRKPDAGANNPEPPTRKPLGQASPLSNPMSAGPAGEIVSGLPAAGIGSPQLAVAPAYANPRAGEIFEVQIEIANAERVAQLPLTLYVDPRVLRLRRVSKGGFLDSDGRLTLQSDIDSERGEARLGLTREAAAPGVSGSGVLLFLEVEAVGPGESVIGFLRGSVIDATGNDMGASFVAGRVVVAP